MSKNTSEGTSKGAHLLAAFILVLVIVHFLFALAVPIAFICDFKPFPFETIFNIWLCQPLFIALFLFIVRSTSQVCRMLVYIDVGVSIFQKASIFFLYAIVDIII